MSATSVESLQLTALEQRNQLHRQVSELREKVIRTRRKLSLSNQAREHFTIFSSLAGLAGLASGYGCADLFTHRRIALPSTESAEVQPKLEESNCSNSENVYRE